jgi:hypothetical protein
MKNITIENFKACSRTAYDNSGLKLPMGNLSVLGRDFIRLDPKEIEYLYEQAKKSKVGIVEAGREKGGSTIILSASNNEVPIYSIDIDNSHDSKLKLIMNMLKVGNNINIIVEDLNDANIDYKYDLVFWSAFPNTDYHLSNFDESELKEIFRKQIYNFYNKMENGGSIVIQCCNYKEVSEVINEMIEKLNVETIVDTDNLVGSICHIKKIR